MDSISKEKRSEVMAKVRSRGNKSTEVRFESLLRFYKINGWRKHYKVIGKPDFAFPKIKLAIFLDGAFWHGHPKRALPKTNTAFWTAKIARNKTRDRRVTMILRAAGWSVLRIWDFDLQQKPDQCIIRLKRLLTIQMKKGTKRYK